MQLTLIFTGVLIIAVFAAAIFDGVLNFGNIAGIVFGIAYIILGIWTEKLSASYQSLCVIAALFVLIVVILKLCAVYSEGKSNADKEKVLIVLGCRIKGDIPSRALVKRVDAAYIFLLNNPDCVAVLSGGQGSDENLSEARCMQQLLYEKGISKDRLILEDKSTTTDENIRFSLEIMAKLGFEKKAAVATSEYHQQRVSLICKKYGLKVSAVSSKTKITLLPTFLLREVFAQVKETIIKK